MGRKKYGWKKAWFILDYDGAVLISRAGLVEPWMIPKAPATYR